ncbi:MAG: MHS family MFS transporter [Alphaproteobacteria bacterium]|nr:MHS family MFS transporter [Alphaproteobacteria bacterium]
MPPKAGSPSTLRHVLMAAAVGSALEWYDFFIYGAASALVFGPLFFPKYDATIGTMASFATFAVGFLARPFGGLFFGHFGDRWGRKPMLVATLLLVGGSTFAIGLLPTYDQVGIWAPLMLLGLRLLQGFGAGAEYGGAVVMSVEFAPPGQRGLYGAFAPMGTTAGNALAASVFWLVTTYSGDHLLTWGWRVPFLVSILLLGLGIYIRAKVSETPVFTEARRKKKPLKLPAFEAVRRSPRNFFVVVGARLAENALGYLYPVFGLSYVINNLGMSRGVAITGVILGNIALVCGLVFFAWLSDRVGRRPVYIFGALFSAAVAFPFFLLVGTRDPALIYLAFIIEMGIGSGAMFGPQAVYFAELFGPRLRYSGFAFARELGSIIAGGPSPFIAAVLVSLMAGAPWGVACYAIFLSLITAFSVWCGPETYKTDIGADDVEDAEEEKEKPVSALLLNPSP